MEIIIYLLLLIVVLGIAYRAYYLQVIRPLRRVVEHVEALAAGKSSSGYVATGIAPLQKLVRDTLLIDQRLQQLSSIARVEEFSLKTILASMVEGVIVTDTHRVIQVANRAFSQMFHLTQDPVKRPLMDVVLQADIKLIIDKTLSTLKDHTGEVVLEDLRGEQSRRIFQVSASPLGEASQGFNGVVVVFHDISRIKQLEELRREFVTNVSHELRTPLAIFHGYLETILGNEELSSEEMQRVLKVMKRHSDRLHELVVDLLTLSRLESGQIRLEPVALNVLGLLKRLQDDWSLLLKNKKCVMLINCSADLPVIEADALRIDQVFYNLLENALKYSDEGKTIEVGSVYLPEAAHIDFYVKDYGTGIPSDKIGNIFQRFYRVDRARSRDKGGTGLGLAIVKHIVQLHGGKVWAESSLGKGTTVWFRLPISLDSTPLESQDLAHPPNSP